MVRFIMEERKMYSKISDIDKEVVLDMVMEALHELYKWDDNLIYPGYYVRNNDRQDNNCTLLEKRIDGTLRHVGERAIVFRFAHYLQNILDEREFDRKLFSVDCEYNRNISGPKKLKSFTQGTYPDVIIHQRGNNDNNLLVMEFKTYWYGDQETDIKKIREFMDGSDNPYHYKFGMAILIDKFTAKIQMYSNDSEDAVVYNLQDYLLGRRRM